MLYKATGVAFQIEGFLFIFEKQFKVILIYHNRTWCGWSTDSIKQINYLKK